MKKMNKKGFTLVELLAVIVVLAIVMLIGVQAVFPQIEKARRQTMAIEAQSIIEAAQTYLMSNSVSGTGTTLPANKNAVSCVSIQQLINDGQFAPKDGSYKGKVKVLKVDNNKYVYRIWLAKGGSSTEYNWMIVGGGSSKTVSGTTTVYDNQKVTESNVVDYSSSWKSTYEACQANDNGADKLANFDS